MAMEATVTTATTRSECSQAADSTEQVRRQLGALSRRENTLLSPIIIRRPHECDITFSESGPAEVWDAAMRPSGLELQDWSSFLLSLEMKSLRRRLRIIKAKLGPSAQQRRRHRTESRRMKSNLLISAECARFFGPKCDLFHRSDSAKH